MLDDILNFKCNLLLKKLRKHMGKYFGNLFNFLFDKSLKFFISFLNTMYRADT